MKKPSILKEEILHYLIDEWNNSLKTHKGGLWLTTRAFQLKLKERGLLTTWSTLSLRLVDLLMVGSVEKINTSAGDCWKPSRDSFQI